MIEKLKDEIRFLILVEDDCVAMSLLKSPATTISSRPEFDKLSNVVSIKSQ